MAASRISTATLGEWGKVARCDMMPTPARDADAPGVGYLPTAYPPLNLRLGASLVCRGELLLLIGLVEQDVAARAAGAGAGSDGAKPITSGRTVATVLNGFE